jgi:hypothetical protein
MQSNSLKTLFKDVHLENQIKVKETSLDLLAIKNILDKLDFDNLFNDHVISAIPVMILNVYNRRGTSLCFRK